MKLDGHKKNLEQDQMTEATSVSVAGREANPVSRVVQTRLSGKWAVRSLFAVIVAIAACTSQPQEASSGKCHRREIDAAETARQLQEFVLRCSGWDVYVDAVVKLNELPVPQAPRLTLRPYPAGSVQILRIVYEADVFFDFLHAYPSDVAFERLAHLISLLGTSFRIDEISISGGADLNEAKITSWRLAAKRAAFLKAYLASSGVGPDARVVVKERAADHSDTAEGRARDRVVELKVTTVRVR